MTDQGRYLYLLFSKIWSGSGGSWNRTAGKIERYKEENKMQQSVLKVQELGAPPEGFESSKPSSKKAFRIWDEWTEAVTSIQKPVTWEEAEILIKCCPTDHMAGIDIFTLYRACRQGRRNGTIPGTHRTLQFGYDEA